MSTVLTTIAAFLLGAVLTLAALSVRASKRYAHLPYFRCRTGPPAAGWRKGRARWCLWRTRAAWLDDVLLVRSGGLRLWLAPLAVSVVDDVEVRALQPGEVRGLGPHPVVLSFTLPIGARFEIAAPAASAERLVGPFLAATVAGRFDADRERGG
jgi:hypothetical protein